MPVSERESHGGVAEIQSDAHGAPTTPMGTLSESTLNLVAQVSPYSKRRANEKEVTWVKKIFGIGVFSFWS